MEYLAAAIVLCGCAWSSYAIGCREGGAKMIDMLEKLGIVIVDDNDDVHPNKLYDSKIRVKK